VVIDAETELVPSFRIGKRVRPDTAAFLWDLYHRQGDPDPDHVSTSFVERQNLTMRMAMRRFTRLTNAFSKKLSHLKAAVALHFAFYNFCRVHQTLRVTPAMQAGIADHVWAIDELLS
jgi:hypothetical protein